MYGFTGSGIFFLTLCTVCDHVRVRSATLGAPQKNHAGEFILAQGNYVLTNQGGGANDGVPNQLLGVTCLIVNDVAYNVVSTLSVFSTHSWNHLCNIWNHPI